ncbi:heme A synthase [Comamonas sp. NLF-1-9]|uniref:COX15/CtaA family protein n=1 Tax=Comamonas sp. NLF-1-9 TaxID=2853163 RepID=UPI001C47786F|nr:COX15/CtaA family protein [Comamonas sp. NLF-1-9]QXL84744.1 COX15/CtaA family protein [Comamonas sp. NLF-1-9]
MNAAHTALYDWAPVWELLAFGALIALFPLAWTAWRHRHGSGSRRLQALTVLTLFLTFDLVLFGAFTRLTDSGLGCPDWPGCYGQSNPLGANAEISAAQAELPSGPVTHTKAWIEMIHRYLATSVGALIVVLTIAAWWQWRRHRQGMVPAPVLGRWWMLATFVWVCLQGAFGALTVTMRLFPAIVTLHLLGGAVLLMLLCVPAVRLSLAVEGRSAVPVARGLRHCLVACMLLVLVQLLLGGWVSTNYAVLACTSFPTCQGSWWPPMAFAEGFQLWRELGLRADGSHISFEALTAIHYTHRLAAYLVLLALAVAAVQLRRRAPALAAQSRWLWLLLVLQFLTGLSNVVLDWPLVAAVLHTGGAAALLVVLTWALTASTSAPAAHPSRTAGASA